MSIAAKTRGAAISGLAAIVLIAVAGGASAQTNAPPVGTAEATADNAVLLTVFLKHDQSRPLSELDAQLAKQGFYKAFPPPGIEVVSWYVEMGIGQVITLRLPASRLREVNRVLEDTAWGAYRTEFIRPTTTNRSGWLSMRKRNSAALDAVFAQVPMPR